MSHWSRSSAQRFIDQRNAKRVEDAKVLYDQSMIKLKAPEVWDLLSKCFERNCTEFNAEPGVGNLLYFDCTDPHRLKISRTDTQALLTVTFIPSLYAVTIAGLTKDERFRFDVISETSDVGLFRTKELFHTEEVSAVSPDDIASAALDMFLEA